VHGRGVGGNHPLRYHEHSSGMVELLALLSILLLQLAKLLHIGVGAAGCEYIMRTGC
jgi:hypothetical protein